MTILQLQARPKMKNPSPATEILQRAAVTTSPLETIPAVVDEVLLSPGQPMDTDTRDYMEPRFGQDFSDVRVHTDARAAQSARAVNALAYTVGRDVVFASGNYAPATTAGRKLLAHELTHVVQQSNGQPNLSISPVKRAAVPVSSQDASLIPHNTHPPVTAISNTEMKLARQPGDDEIPAYEITDEDMLELETTMRDLMGLLDDSTRATVLRNKTLAIGLAADTEGNTFLVYTVSGNWINQKLKQVTEQLGLERWDAVPRTTGRGAVGAPEDAEQLMIEGQDMADAVVKGMAVSRPVCEDCALAIEFHEYGPIRVVEVHFPMPQAPVAAAPAAEEGTAGPEQQPPSAETPQTSGGTQAEPQTPAPVEYQIQAGYRVLNTESIPGGRVVTDVEVVLGDGLNSVNEAAQANGAVQLSSRIVLRITTEPNGAFVGAESTTGESGALAEALAQQALTALTKAGSGAESGVAGAVASVSPWVRGLSWAGILIFFGVTAYQYKHARPEDKPRVLADAGGGLVGGMVAGYAVCNLVLGIETVGWSLLICGGLVGIPGGMAGSAIADVAYDEATIDDDEIRAWVSDHDPDAIGMLPVAEKIRMIFSLMKGWISEVDVQAMEKICMSVKSRTELQLIEAAVEPQIGSMSDIGQRTRLRSVLTRL
jgi:hypothetical protein